MTRGGIGSALASVATGGALLAFAPIGLRLSELGPQATAFWRFVFALPLLAIGFALAPEKPSLKDWGLLGAAGASFGADLALFHAALVLTTVVNATLLSNMTPVFAAAAGWVIFRQRVGWSFAGGALTALAGAGLLATARAQSGHDAGGTLGDALGLASAVFYAAYLVVVSSARQRVGVRVTMFVTTFASLLFVLVTALIAQENFLPESWRGWAVLVGLGVVVHVGGQGLIALGIGRLPIALSTVLLWIQPVTAAGLSWLLFGEALGPLAFLGAALILGGVWIVQRTRAR
jgi:drug/metabolite transporter (DMT)-like permease